ncbi:hypothetical protein PVL30_000845 [Lodderomyces elongisporus]|uniref:uncharacterized protein n=1 Tax=Lodderomyces elongisporus TaxID=36914 RepID=UPI002922DBA2|nr:uncharacterized protein PVL30_000845 [Lodderomyces elongisporus]WLF77136.1 hypothetical protein PVL30_000845 [Lodderomyces elongisporus]
MFSQSGTGTPVPTNAKNAPVPIHDTIGDSVTWVYDWYSPNFNEANTGAIVMSKTGRESTEIQYLNNNNIGPLQLKGWFKTNHNHKSGFAKYDQDANATLDLTEAKWQYMRKFSNEDIVEKEALVRSNNSAVKTEDTALEGTGIVTSSIV